MKFDDTTWTRLVWDTNRMRKPTRREFHTSAQERHGAQTILTETAASELAGIIDPRNLERSLANACAGAANPDALRPTLAASGQRNVDLYVRMNIWWAEEWLRPDSPYDIRVLDQDEREHANELLERLARARVFPRLTPETTRSHPDAIIICETAALGRRYSGHAEHGRSNRHRTVDARSTAGRTHRSGGNRRLRRRTPARVVHRTPRLRL